MAVTFRNRNVELVPARYVPPSNPARTQVPSHPIQVAFGNVVDALLRAGWDVPFVDVEFGTSGSGSNVQRSVHLISGTGVDGPFAVETWGRYGVHRIVVPPGVEMKFDGPDAYPRIAYPRTEAWNEEGVAAASDHHGRRDSSVRYRYGSRGYSLDPDGIQDHDRAIPDVGAVVEHARSFLAALEARLRALPAVDGCLDVQGDGDANLRRLVTREPIPVPAGFPLLFSWVEDTEAKRIVDPTSRWDDGSHDFVLSGVGQRVVPLGGRPFGAGNLPDDAYRGFSYASPDPSVRARQSIASDDRLSMPVAVRLRRLDEVFVVDNAAFAKATNEVFERIGTEGRSRMTDRELDSCMAAVGLTLVPASMYDGSYVEPTYLIGRQLGPDEARLMSGPVTHVIEGDHERVVLADRDATMTLFEDQVPSASERERAKRVAAEAKRMSAMATVPFRNVRPFLGAVSEASERREAATR